jgi:hypothetical protein
MVLYRVPRFAVTVTGCLVVTSAIHTSEAWRPNVGPQLGALLMAPKVGYQYTLLGQSTILSWNLAKNSYVELFWDSSGQLLIRVPHQLSLLFLQCVTNSLFPAPLFLLANFSWHSRYSAYQRSTHHTDRSVVIVLRSWRNMVGFDNNMLWLKNMLLSTSLTNIYVVSGWLPRSNHQIWLTRASQVHIRVPSALCRNPLYEPKDQTHHRARLYQSKAGGRHHGLSPLCTLPSPTVCSGSRDIFSFDFLVYSSYWPG